MSKCSSVTKKRDFHRDRNREVHFGMLRGVSSRGGEFKCRVYINYKHYRGIYPRCVSCVRYLRGLGRGRKGWSSR